MASLDGMELPEEHELIWLFEQEPELTDPDLPWYYNELTFSLDREREQLVCVIYPAAGEIQINVTREERPVINLTLGFVTNIAVRKEKDREWLIADFALERVEELRLQVKPYFKLSWGTALL